MDSSLVNFASTYGSGWTLLLDTYLKVSSLLLTSYESGTQLGFKIMLKNDDLKTMRLLCYAQYTHTDDPNYYTTQVGHTNSYNYYTLNINGTLVLSNSTAHSLTQGRIINSKESHVGQLYQLGATSNADCWCLYEWLNNSELTDTISISFSYRNADFLPRVYTGGRAFTGESYLSNYIVTKLYEVTKDSYKPTIKYGSITIDQDNISYMQTFSIDTAANNLWYMMSNSEENTSVNYSSSYYESGQLSTSKSFTNTDWNSGIYSTSGLKYLYAVGSSINNASIPKSISDSNKYKKVSIQYAPNNVNNFNFIKDSTDNTKFTLTINKHENIKNYGYFNVIKFSTSSSGSDNYVVVNCNAYLSLLTFILDFTIDQNSSTASAAIKDSTGSQTLATLSNIIVDQSTLEFTIYAFPGCKDKNNNYYFSSEAKELNSTLDIKINITSLELVCPQKLSTIYANETKVGIRVQLSKVPSKIEICKSGSLSTASYIFSSGLSVDNKLVFKETNLTTTKYRVKIYRDLNTTPDSTLDIDDISFTKDTTLNQISSGYNAAVTTSQNIKDCIKNTCDRYKNIFSDYSSLKYENFEEDDIADDKVKTNFNNLNLLLTDIKSNPFINTSGLNEYLTRKDVSVEEAESGIIYINVSLDDSYNNNNYSDGVITNSDNFSSQYTLNNNLIVANNISSSTASIIINNNYENVSVFLMKEVL